MHDTLAHAARELMRVGVDAPRSVRNADPPQRVHGTVPCRLRRQALVRSQHQPHLVGDGQDRIERRHRVLKDHRDLAAAHAAKLLLRQADEFDSLEPHRTCDDAAGRVDEPEQREPGDALARPGFTDEPEHLAALQREGDAVDRLHHSDLGEEVRGEIPHLQERAHRFNRGLS